MDAFWAGRDSYLITLRGAYVVEHMDAVAATALRDQLTELLERDADFTAAALDWAKH